MPTMSLEDLESDAEAISQLFKRFAQLRASCGV